MVRELNTRGQFKAAVVKYFVCDLSLLDSAYTERFMGLPNVTDNYKGYEEAELLKVADQLRDKQYLLVSKVNVLHVILLTIKGGLAEKIFREMTLETKANVFLISCAVYRSINMVLCVSLGSWHGRR